jgi:hypothetical protein
MNARCCSVTDDAMILNAAGAIAEGFRATIPEHFPHVELDVFVMMPNHVHGILVFSDAGDSGQPSKRTCPYGFAYNAEEIIAIDGDWLLQIHCDARSSPGHSITDGYLAKSLP